MYLTTIVLNNFRNYEQRTFKFDKGINVIYGYNGQGKTNLLEAIAICCISKSFRTNNDGDGVQFGKSFFRLTANVIFDQGVKKQIVVEYGVDSGKKILIEGDRVTTIREMVGSLPIVILTPDDEEITKGPPVKRRKFLNFILSQLEVDYLNSIQKFQRIVKQRNRILQQAKEKRFGLSQRILPWDRELFNYAKLITRKRADFITELTANVKSILQEITLQKEEVSLRYVPSLPTEFWDKDFNEFEAYLETIRNKEILMEVTLIGPHRDDVLIFLNQHDLRRFGSRGQHLTVLVALKIAEYFFLLNKKKEKPLFLLDDIYTEIDEIREHALTDFFKELGQIFLTTSKVDMRIREEINKVKSVNYLFIENQAQKEE
ncbi:hypothetical protein DRQ15_03880 [candidate division KSB1 bacterium]|nr:MAG: hypothetical protein DRQ12_00035 [candidate division KSB1 bacterium]RKY91892.1 MAG: hypothetical protein DRQ15_03880 [candidate division KSB1 bacterium]